MATKPLGVAGVLPHPQRRPLPAPGASPSVEDPEGAEQASVQREALLTATCLLALILGWALASLTPVSGMVVLALYGVAYLTGGAYPLRNTITALRRHIFDVNLLMVLAALGAAAVNQWREGAILMFLFSLSGTLERYAMGRSRHAIRALMKLSPEEALVRREGIERVVPVAALIIGDVIIVHPGERVPADGTVIAGASSVDQAPITGESVPVAKGPGAPVFAATINGDGALEIAVGKLASESTLARVIRLVEEAQAQQTPTQRLTELIGTRYTIGVLVGVALVIAVPPLLFAAPLSASFYRAMTLMTVASPCALVLSTPAAILSAIAVAARWGILFKGGGSLEDLGRVRVIAFDKTGTLTRGTPQVTDLVPVAGVSTEQLLAVAAAAESRSEHPLAHAVVACAKVHEIILPAVEDMHAVVGKGVEARCNDQVYRVGTASLLEAAGVCIPEQVTHAAQGLRTQGKTAVFVAADDACLGVLALADVVRPGARAVIAHLRQLGISHIVMLTGDNHEVAQTIAAELGIDEVRADLLPEDKLAVIHDLAARYGAVAMVGDGVNDAPALAAATVGIAMGGAGTDVALETADVALMGDDLIGLVDGVALSRDARRIVRENVTIALGMIAVLVLVAAPGLIRLPVGVVGHEGSTLFVVANGLRLLGSRRVTQ